MTSNGVDNNGGIQVGHLWDKIRSELQMVKSEIQGKMDDQKVDELRAVDQNVKAEEVVSETKEEQRNSVLPYVQIFEDHEPDNLESKLNEFLRTNNIYIVNLNFRTYSNGGKMIAFTVYKVTIRYKDSDFEKRYKIPQFKLFRGDSPEQLDARMSNFLNQNKDIVKPRIQYRENYVRGNSISFTNYSALLSYKVKP